MSLKNSNKEAVTAADEFIKDEPKDWSEGVDMENNKAISNELSEVQKEVVPVTKEPDKLKERLLLAGALVIGLLFDLLVLRLFQAEYYQYMVYQSVFWLSFFAIFLIFYYKKINDRKVLWYVGACCVALCAWNIFFTKNEANMEYAILNMLVLPAVLMGFAQYTAGDYQLKEAGKVFLAWLSGWIITPFSGIAEFFRNLFALFGNNNRSALSKVLLAVALTIPLLLVLIMLLVKADAVFAYYTSRLFANLDLAGIIVHSGRVILATMLIYSFLWNVGFGKNHIKDFKWELKIDKIIVYVMLSAVIVLYLLFCGIQFTYLFARAGLPIELTYSQYAREGFAQTVFVCLVNLVIFGVILRYKEQEKIGSALLAVLLALTGLMLVSGGIRLQLYIDAYGFTWLRMISAWFIIYLVAVLVICFVRLFQEKVPALALAFLVLVGWFVTLGYLDPQSITEKYNTAHACSDYCRR